MIFASSASKTLFDLPCSSVPKTVNLASAFLVVLSFDLAVIVTFPAFKQVMEFPSIIAIVSSLDANAYSLLVAFDGLIPTSAVTFSPTLALFCLKIM